MNFSALFKNKTKAKQRLVTPLVVYFVGLPLLLGVPVLSASGLHEVGRDTNQTSKCTNLLYNQTLGSGRGKGIELNSQSKNVPGRSGESSAASSERVTNSDASAQKAADNSSDSDVSDSDGSDSDSDSEEEKDVKPFKPTNRRRRQAEMQDVRDMQGRGSEIGGMDRQKALVATQLKKEKDRQDAETEAEGWEMVGSHKDQQAGSDSKK